MPRITILLLIILLTTVISAQSSRPVTSGGSNSDILELLLSTEDETTDPDVMDLLSAPEENEQVSAEQSIRDLLLPVDSAATGPLPTDEAFLNFLSTLQSAVNNFRPDLMDRYVNLDLIISRALQGTFIPPQHRLALRANLKSLFSFGNGLISAVGKKGQYVAIQFTPEPGNMTALFRLVGVEGLDYHLYKISYQGEFQIDDVYIFSQGDYLSQILGGFIGAMLKQGENMPETMCELQREFSQDRADYGNDFLNYLAMLYCLDQEWYDKAHGYYLMISESTRQTKVLQAFNLDAVSRLSSEKFNYYADQFAKGAPTPVSRDIVALQHLMRTSNATEALSCLDRIEAAIIEDGYVSYLKALMHLKLGNMAEVFQFGEKAIATEPWMRESYFLMIDQQLARGNFGEVCDLMVKLKGNTGYIFTERMIYNEAKFAAFAASEEFNILGLSYFADSRNNWLQR